MPKTIIGIAMTVLITTAVIAAITHVRPLARFAGLPPADNAIG